MFQANLAPIQFFGLPFPFCDNAFIMHFPVPLGLVGNAVDEEEHTSFPDGHQVMVPARHRREELCFLSGGITAPVIVR